MDLREALGRSTMHALPRAIKSRSMHGRAFWCSVFLVANLILGYHVFRLLNRYLQHNVTTTIRTKLNDTLLLPVVYMMLFNTEKIVTDMPYKVRIDSKYSQKSISNTILERMEKILTNASATQSPSKT